MGNLQVRFLEGWAPAMAPGYSTVVRFIRHAARWRRFFRCSLAASNFPIPLGLNLLLMPGEHVLRRDVADGAVQTNVVVMLYVTLNQTPRIFERQRRPGRMHSALSDLCQRSILPFDCG